GQPSEHADVDAGAVLHVRVTTRLARSRTTGAVAAARGHHDGAGRAGVVGCRHTAAGARSGVDLRPRWRSFTAAAREATSQDPEGRQGSQRPDPYPSRKAKSSHSSPVPRLRGHFQPAGRALPRPASTGRAVGPSLRPDWLVWYLNPRQSVPQTPGVWGQDKAAIARLRLV